MLLWSAILLCGLGRAPGAQAKGSDPREEAAAISQVAESKNNAGEFAMCGELFQQAYRLDPSYLAYLFSAARCEQKAGQLDAAERDFRAFLARSPASDALVDKAKKFLDEILEERKKEPAVKPAPAEPVAPGSGPTEAAKPTAEAAAVPPAAPPVVTQPAPPARLGAWATTAGGAAVFVAGAAALAAGLSQRGDLRDQLTAGTSGGLIVAMTPAQARSRESTWQSWVTAGGIGMGLGAVATGLGLWWLGDSSATDSAVAGHFHLLPTREGAALLVRF